MHTNLHEFTQLQLPPHNTATQLRGKGGLQGENEGGCHLLGQLADEVLSKLLELVSLQSGQRLGDGGPQTHRRGLDTDTRMRQGSGAAKCGPLLTGTRSHYGS